MRARCFSGGRRDWVVGSEGGMRPLRRGGEGVVESCELVHDEVVAKKRNRRGDRLRDIWLTLKKPSPVTASHQHNISFQKKNTWKTNILS